LIARLDEPFSPDEENILEHILTYKNLPIAAFLVEMFSRDIVPSYFEKYRALTGDHPYLYLTMIPIAKWCKDTKDARFIAEFLHDKRKDFKDARSGLMQQWLLTCKALEESTLPDARKLELLSTVNNKQHLGIVQVLCALKREDLLLIPDILFSELLRRCLSEDPYLGLQGIDPKKYLETFGNMRIPLAWATYEAGLTRIGDVEVQKEFRRFFVSVLNNTVTQERYRTDNSPHLKKIEETSPEVFTKWQTAIPSFTLDKLNERAFSFAPFLKDKIHDRHLVFEQLPNEIQILCNELKGEFSQEKLFVLLEQLKASDQFPFPEFIHDIESLIQVLSRPIENKEYIVVDTDNWQDLYLSGTEVPGSCQRVDGDPDLNKCLLAYVMDGKNRMVAVKDPSGKIVARALIRHLWDITNQKPVIFLDRFYPQPCAFEEAITQMALLKAKALNIPLISDRGEAYAGKVVSLGSPSPYEYADASDGVMKGGIFTINSPKLLYAAAAA